jgi:hypothetical protein
VPEAEARALVAQNGAHWFREGLRVFFVLPGAPDDADAPGHQLTGALRIACLE